MRSCAPVRLAAKFGAGKESPTHHVSSRAIDALREDPIVALVPGHDTFGDICYESNCFYSFSLNGRGYLALARRSGALNEISRELKNALALGGKRFVNEKI